MTRHQHDQHRDEIMRERGKKPLATLAQALLRSGQRLRADETACALTFTLHYAATRREEDRR